jgi:hypothetical protein
MLEALGSMPSAPKRKKERKKNATRVFKKP